jgi:hypothetical protein
MEKEARQLNTTLNPTRPRIIHFISSPSWKGKKKKVRTEATAWSANGCSHSSAQPSFHVSFLLLYFIFLARGWQAHEPSLSLTHRSRLICKKSLDRSPSISKLAVLLSAGQLRASIISDVQGCHNRFKLTWNEEK